MLSSISTLPFSPHLSSAQLPSSNFLSPPVAALVHYSTAIILTPRTMKFPPFPTSLGTLITFQRISLMSYLIMKILQYCHHFNPQDDEVSSLSNISWNSHHLPADFINELFNYEDWGDSSDAHHFFPPPITRARDSELPTLSVWCPEDSADPSPDHSITICNSSDSPFSCSGPSLSLADWHSALPTGRTVWQCSHTHSPNSALLSYLFPRLLQCWLAFWSLEKLPFGEAVKNSFSTLIANPSPMPPGAFPRTRFLSTLSAPSSIPLLGRVSVLKALGMVRVGLPWQGLLLTNTSTQSLFLSPSVPLHLPLTRCLPFRPLSRLPQS